MSEEPKKVEKKTKVKASKDDDKLWRLERCLAKVCHYTGSERLLDEFGIERWKPGTKDMRRGRD